MPQLLTLSRAARLVGVSRSTLQKQMRENKLETFEGMIKTSDLLRVYPKVDLEDDTELERVTQLKSALYTTLPEQFALPEPAVLAGRLSNLSRELTEAKEALGGYTEFKNRLTEKLAAIEQIDDSELRAEFRKLADWVDQESDRRPEVPKYKAELLAKDTFLRMLAANVKLIPSGHEFFVDGTDSILEAALRVGLTPDYGCTDGSCGACKARVVSGDVLKIHDPKYQLSETERNLGYILMCCNTAVTDLTIEAGEATGVEDIPVQNMQTSITKQVRSGEDLVILNLRTPQSQTLRFLAGQRAKLTLDGITAHYSIASCPCDEENLQFHIRRKPNNPFTDYVFDQLQPDQTVELTGPEGEFLLHEDTPNPVLFIAFNDGFAPIKSLIEHAISADIIESYHLYWIVSRADGHYMNNLCRSWKGSLDDFEYTPIVAETSIAQKDAVAQIGKEYSDLSRHYVYAAGRDVHLDMLKNVLIRTQLPESQLSLRTL